MDWVHKIRQDRGLIRFLHIQVLCGLLHKPIADPLLRSRIVAELTMRGWLLSGGGPWRDLPERIEICHAWQAYGLGPEASDALERWLESQIGQRAYEFPVISGISNNVVTLVKKDLGNWCCADGAFPVVARAGSAHFSSCTLLPFISEKTGSYHAAGVRTSSGEALEGLRGGLDQAVRVLRWLNVFSEQDHLRVTLFGLTGPRKEITGRSIGLPLLIAEYIKRFSRRPRSLALCSSGCIADNGQLDRDLTANGSLEVKAEWMKRCGITVRIFPDHSSSDKSAFTWPVSENLIAHLSNLESLACSDMHSAFRGVLRSAREIEDRLDKINVGMRFGKIGAHDAYRELNEMSSVLAVKTDVKSQRLRLHCDELIATACCHMGRTRESAMLTDRILEHAQDVGPYYVAEALVRQAVNMTDFADYARAVAYCDEAINLLPELKTPDERLDLELKAISSKAQALTYWSLVDEAYLSESLALTKHAVELAKDLDGDYPDNPERNLPRNLTYLHGWYALHRPLEAESMQRGIAGTVLADPHSAAYFMRNRWLSAYRAYLSGNYLDWLSFEDQLPDEKTGWLWSLSLKYRGAVRAGAGKIDTAREDFSRAASLLKQIDSNPLLAFIGATAALQAAESLKNTDLEQSARYSSAALPVFDAFDGWFKAAKLDAAKWRSRAEALLGLQSLEDVPNPQLHYLY
jgi:hypothetical protein